MRSASYRTGLPVILCGRGSQWPQRCPHCFFRCIRTGSVLPGESHRLAASFIVSMAGGVYVCHRRCGGKAATRPAFVTLDQLSVAGRVASVENPAGRFLGVGPQPFASRSSAAPMGLSARPALSRPSARLISSASAPCWSANDRMMAASLALVSD